MRVIIGFGNTLRGEDAFGVDVINQLQKYFKEKASENTKLISVFQLTPELCLELLEAKEIIFIDALYSLDLKYTLACDIKQDIKGTNLSHHISPKIIISMLKDLYNCSFTYEIFSMTTCNFEEFEKNDKNKEYKNCVKKVANFIKDNPSFS
ncbi:MAG: hydrogenase maturation protease [Halarcobacter sp.]